jgi:uncharacterized protein YukE
VTATISLVAGSQPEALIAAAGRLQGSIAALDAQIAAQQQALAQLGAGWQGTAAQAAIARARQDLQRQHELQVRLQAMRSALIAGGGQLSVLRTQVLTMAAQATSLGGLVGDDGTVQATGLGQLMTPAVAAAYTAILRALLSAFDAVDQATASALNNVGAPARPRHGPGAGQAVVGLAERPGTPAGAARAPRAVGQSARHPG